MGRPLDAIEREIAVSDHRTSISLLQAALDIFRDDMTPEARERVEEGIAEREAALDRVEANAPDEWIDAATWAVYEIALKREEFTADSVWALLERRGVPPPPEPKALGAVMRFGARAGWIEATDRTTQSTRPECHARPIRVWRSQITGKEVLA